MNKRVFIIHGWGAHPEDGWYQAVGAELHSRGYDVAIPQMPNTEAPEMNAWLDRIAKIVGTPDEHTYFIGHSIGCQTILRYIATVLDAHVASVICVAGWFTLTGLTSGEQSIAEPWLTTPFDVAKARNATTDLIAIFSQNDPYVPYEENKASFEQKLGAVIRVVESGGHFSDGDAIPPVLEYLS